MVNNGIGSGVKNVVDNLTQNIENGSVVAGKSLTSKAIENVSDESGSYQSNPFIFQATGTDNNTTETPVAPVAKQIELRGNTLVFNQLVDTDTTEIETISGHKYLTLLSGVKSLLTATGATLTVSAGDNVFDLTVMFGSGNEPTSVLEFNRVFPLPAYAYNAGELISCSSNQLITVGYNQLLAQDTFIRVIAGQTYRLMFWNGEELKALTSGSIAEYNGAKTLIKTTAYNSLSSLYSLDSEYPNNGDKGLTLTAETQYVKITGSSDTNILFNIAWDGSRPDYEEYISHTYGLPTVTLNSVGEVYDSYTNSGEITTAVGILNNQSGEIGDTITISGCKSNSINIMCNEFGMLSEWGTISGTTITLTKALTNATIYYELAEPTVTTGLGLPENIEVDDFGTMQFMPSTTESSNNPAIPQGNQFFYPADYVLLLDDLNSYTDGDVNNLALNNETYELIEKIIVGYSLTTSEPEDWSTNWTGYFINTGTVKEPIYTAVVGESAPEWMANTYYSFDSAGQTFIDRTKETDGTNYNFKKVIIELYPKTQWAYATIKYDNAGSDTRKCCCFGTIGANCYAKCLSEIKDNNLVINGIRREGTQSYANTLGYFNLVQDVRVIDHIAVLFGSFGSKIPANTEIYIYAVRN